MSNFLNIGKREIIFAFSEAHNNRRGDEQFSEYWGKGNNRQKFLLRYRNTEKSEIEI
ncbi:MAG: hypothetical protein F6K24_39380 [Okeania sp. SIO2D1]|nr:hypothetical protein [Okeania sp. SIO3B5]NES70847.1 hypothetical protein [Okeania sp. SIO2D1]